MTVLGGEIREECESTRIGECGALCYIPLGFSGHRWGTVEGPCQDLAHRSLNAGNLNHRMSLGCWTQPSPARGERGKLLQWRGRSSPSLAPLHVPRYDVGVLMLVFAARCKPVDRHTVS